MSKLAVLVGCLPLFIALSGCADRTAQQNERLAEAKQAQDAGQHSRAVDVLTRLIAEAQDGQASCRALYLRGKSYSLAGRADLALADLRRCTEQNADPESTWRAFVLLGTIHFEERADWPAAREAYAAAAARMPGESRRDVVLFRLGIACERTGQWGAALRWYDELVQRYPTSAAAQDARRRLSLRADHFAIQCGAFGVERNALELVTSLTRRGFEPYVRREPRGQTYLHVVLVGRYATYDEALRQLGALRQVVPNAVVWP